jgi:hypothetical protein
MEYQLHPYLSGLMNRLSIFIYANLYDLLQSDLFYFSFVGIQVKLSVSGREFKLALIARRSRHYAGTRYGWSSKLLNSMPAGVNQPCLAALIFCQ